MDEDGTFKCETKIGQGMGYIMLYSYLDLFSLNINIC